MSGRRHTYSQSDSNNTMARRSNAMAIQTITNRDDSEPPEESHQHETIAGGGPRNDPYVRPLEKNLKKKKKKKKRIEYITIVQARHRRRDT